MGIVASCPQGHRVKVKDHLAGRKGICPECGARFRIPLESQAEPAAPGASPQPAAAAIPAATTPTGIPLARLVSLDTDLAATLPRALPLAPPEPGGPN